MMKKRSWLVYGALAAIWIFLVAWQAWEHVLVRRAARAQLLQRAEDISNTMALIMRSQRLFVSRERTENALRELVKQGDMLSIRLLNAAGEEVAAVGPPIETPRGELPPEGLWDPKTLTVTFMNLVNLGTNVIMSTNEFATNIMGRIGGPPREPGPPPEDRDRPAPQMIPPPLPPSTNAGETPPSTNSTRRGSSRFRSRFSDEEWKNMIQNKSAHDFVMVMSAQSLLSSVQHDFLLRVFIIFLGSLAVGGSGLALRNLGKNSELQIRLVRASELNSHLKQMNLAAAGLAHETRNPLNIIRGLAQMIFKLEAASPEVRLKSREIIEETDRVASQLNEFINYARPREVRRASIRVDAVVGEVIRALNYDIEEKKVAITSEAGQMVIEADEQLLRQALFNLVLNAIQAVPAGGKILVRTGRDVASNNFLEVSDNGPGVAPEHRTEIFKPYFTTHEEGTGLGLAVVQQIVLAHGWEIECTPNQPMGACFRISHLKLAAKS